MAEFDIETVDSDSKVGERSRSVRLPRCCSLTGFALNNERTEKIPIKSLAPGTALIVQTENSEYRLIVLEGGCHGVLVQGGTLFPRPRSARLQGASAGGSFLKTGCIEVGYRIELLVGDDRIITSPVQSVTIEHLPAALYRFQRPT